MSQKIEPINLWISGEIKIAEWFELFSSYDNLKSTAVFKYKLYENKNEDEDEIYGRDTSIVSGTLSMSTEEYENWASQSGDNVNDWAYNWAASKLNLTIIQ
jgi:hypothetical protein